MNIEPQPSPVVLSIVGKTGKIEPAIVTIDTVNNSDLVVRNTSAADITVVLPHGISGAGSIFGVEKRGSISIPIDGRAPHGIEIPYWVFFSQTKRENPPLIHDWGVAASPPTMILYP